MITFNVHVNPGSRHPKVGRTYGDALRVHVGARAVGGAANKEVVRVLAEMFNVKTHSVEVLRGSLARNKLIGVHGDDEALALRLAELLSSPPGPEATIS